MGMYNKCIGRDIEVGMNRPLDYSITGSAGHEYTVVSNYIIILLWKLLKVSRRRPPAKKSVHQGLALACLIT